MIITIYEINPKIFYRPPVIDLHRSSLNLYYAVSCAICSKQTSNEYDVNSCCYATRVILSCGMKSNLKERAMGRIARLMGLMDETIGAANMYRCHDHRYGNGIRRNDCGVRGMLYLFFFHLDFRNLLFIEV